MLHIVIPAGCCCCAWFISWVIFVIAMSKTNSLVLTLKLPDLTAFQYDWDQPLIQSIYTVEGDKYCEVEDIVLFNFIWPGTLSTCLGEAVSFDEKRSRTSVKYKNYWREKTCSSNGYGN